MSLVESFGTSIRKQIPYAAMAATVLSMYIIGLSAWSHLAPTSMWFEIRKVFVYDTVVGVPPRIEPDRTISRPFWGEWVVSVERINPNGSHSAGCTTKGANDYRVGAETPLDADLIWWMRSDACVPRTPGRYQITTSWRIEPFGYSEREISNTSNIFEVRPAETARPETMAPSVSQFATATRKAHGQTTIAWQKEILRRFWK